MNRREALLSGAALAAATFVGYAKAAEMEHHHHAAMVNAGLVAAAADCIQKGQVCLSHCLQLLGQGDKEMAACAKSVNQMLALCGALQSLANQESAYLPQLAKIAMDACIYVKMNARNTQTNMKPVKPAVKAAMRALKNVRKLPLNF